MTADSPPIRRRWLQVSLRTLFVAICVVGIALGWVGNVLVRVRTQREVVGRIEALGGKCDYDYKNYENHDFFYFPIPERSASGPPGPAWLRRIMGDDVFARIAWVSFDSYAQISDEDLELLSQLPDLRYVEIFAPVTDVGITHLSRLRNLRCLTLSQAHITTNGCKLLSSIRSLEELELEGGPMTLGDEGVAHIVTLPNLRSLKLSFGGMTDMGMEHLASCQHLEALNVNSSPLVTDQGVIQLCNLHRVRQLQLQSIGMSDESMPHLAKMQQLRGLFLDTYITDAGLRHLHTLKNLRYLQVHGEEITHDAAVALRDALPNCGLAVSPGVERTFRSRRINVRNEQY